ncbi:MAG: type I restriction enzyme HsdR N-terminal domain-containing protein [Bacteroidetes bacterium]|nr:MAG: type I restriction enzyme HsdR N-terminal domain-containing protein [Bacteroidota bacterium]
MFVYPKYSLKTRKNHEKKTEVWDIVRRKWILLTPEELVRQHLIHYLTHEKKYPLEIIAVEREFQLFNVKKRFDVAVLNKQRQFILIAECKAPNIDLNEEVVHQILTYNLKLNAHCLVITNGIQQYVYEKKNKEWSLSNDIKAYNEW